MINVSLTHKRPLTSPHSRLPKKSPTLKMNGGIFVNNETFLTSDVEGADVT